MENHFLQLGEPTFLAPNFLVHFRESLHRSNKESLIHFYVNNYLVEFLLDSAKNQLGELCQTWLRGSQTTHISIDLIIVESHNKHHHPAVEPDE